MAFEVFNFGKQLGIVGGNSAPTNLPPVLVGRIEKDVLSSIRGGTGYGPINGPVYGSEGDNPISPVNPWVRKQLDELLKEINSRGNTEQPHGGGTGKGGGGGTGWSGGWGGMSPGTVNPNAGQATAALYNRVFTSLKKITDPPCDKKTDPGCCTNDQLLKLTQDLIMLFDKLKENGFEEVADCLEEEILSGKYKIKCPNDSPFYYYGIHFDDPVWDEFVRNPKDNLTIEFPDELLAIADGVYSLASLLGVCNDYSLTSGYTIVAFISLGLIPECYQLRELMNKILEELNISYEEFQRTYSGVNIWVGDQEYLYDPDTGYLYQVVNGKNIKKAQWPSYLCKV